LKERMEITKCGLLHMRTERKGVALAESVKRKGGRKGAVPGKKGKPDEEREKKKKYGSVKKYQMDPSPKEGISGSLSFGEKKRRGQALAYPRSSSSEVTWPCD